MTHNQNVNNNQPQNWRSRLNNTSSTNANQNQPANNQTNNNNSLRSRFANNNKTQKSKPTWTITPMRDVGVKIGFQGIGDPLFRILGTPLDKSLSDVTALVDKLTEDEALYQQLFDKLNDVWEAYDFRGATMMHPIRSNILTAFTSPVLPIIEPEPVDDVENTDNSNNVPPLPVKPKIIASPYKVYRAVDTTFVLNVLGRVRGNVLVQDTPLALEMGFLNQSYICDDIRLVDLAIATGAIEEV
jgi:hypothetical protein